MNIRNFIEAIEKDKFAGPSRARTLKAMLDAPCLKYCGLCNDPCDDGPTEVDDEHVTEDIVQLRQLAASRERCISDVNCLYSPRTTFCEQYGQRPVQASSPSRE